MKLRYKEGRVREITSNFTALAQTSSSFRGSPRVQGEDKTQWGSDEPSKSGSVGISKLKLLVNHSSSHNLLVMFSKERLVDERCRGCFHKNKFARK